MKTSLFILTALFATTVTAHNQVADNLLAGTPAKNGVSVTTGLAATYRADIEEQTTVWQIPGKQMGGDSWYPEPGFSLDEASLAAAYRAQSGVIAAAEINAHHGADPEIEQAWAGYASPLSDTQPAWQVAAGRLKGAFSPETALHASQRAFSDNRLLDNAFYGGHFRDNGLQAVAAGTNWVSGLELWGGDNFPGSAGTGGGTQDLFAYWSGQQAAFRWKAGGWLLHARADDRVDDRLESGHSHGSTVTTTDNPVRFDGKEEHLGLHVEANYTVANDLQFGLSAELIFAEVTGDLRDNTRTATLDGSYRGFWIQPAVSWSGNQHLAVRYERLVLKNHLSGPGAAILAESGGLQSSGDDPTSFGVSYRFYPVTKTDSADGWHNLGIRLEWTRADAGIEDDYFGLGLVFAAHGRVSGI
jgi:hypothetical protein